VGERRHHLFFIRLPAMGGFYLALNWHRKKASPAEPVELKGKTRSRNEDSSTQRLEKNLLEEQCVKVCGA
jgi:hypothetical protein